MFKSMLEEVVRMSRRRSANPTRAISITLPVAILDAMDDQLTRTQSRSAWIAAAITMRLEQRAMEIETRQLMAMLHARCVLDFEDDTLRYILQDRLQSN